MESIGKGILSVKNGTYIKGLRGWTSARSLPV